MSDNDSLILSNATEESLIDNQTEISQQPPSSPVKERKKRSPKSPSKAPVAKRHMKLHKNSLAGIRKPSIRRLGFQAGVERFTESLFPEVRNLLHARLQKIVSDCVTLAEHKKKKTIRVPEVIYVFKAQGRTLYGYK